MSKSKRPVLFTSDAVMYEMDNGWFYFVSTTADHIAVYGHPIFYTRFNPYCKPAKSENDVPAQIIHKTKQILSKLPVQAAISAFQRYAPFEGVNNPFPAMLSRA